MSPLSASDLLAGRVDELRVGLNHADPVILAERTGSTYVPQPSGTGQFSLSVWNRPVVLTYPGLHLREGYNQEELPPYLQALVLYYFTTCDGTLPCGTWISFSELMDGRFYAQAFQGYSGNALTREFGNHLELFCQAAEHLDGERVYLFGDAAYRIQVLPLVPLLVVYSLGDEDFPPSGQVLFDAAVNHHLPTDACAVIGGQLCGKLIKYLDHQFKTSSGEGQ